MKRFYYNNLFHARIKSIILGVWGILPICLALYLITTGTIENTFGAFITSLALFAPLFLIVRMRSGQLIEITDDGKCLSYFHWGPFKFKPNALEGPLKVAIEQDADRYYVLKLIGSKDTIVIERQPTLSQIQKFGDALKEAFTE